MKRFALCLAVLAVSLALTHGQAQAELITYDYSGHLTFVFDDSGYLGGAIAAGDAFTGSFTYEAPWTDSRPLNLYVGLYYYYPAGLNGISLTVTGAYGGTGTLKTDPASFYQVSVANPPPGGGFPDTFGASQDEPTRSGIFSSVPVGLVDDLLDLYLWDSGRTALSSDALPTSLDLADFPDQHEVEFLSLEPHQLIIAGEIEILTRRTEPIPEPSTILLLTTGLGGIAVYGLRRRKKT